MIKVRNPLVSSVFVVAGTWWIVFTVWAFWRYSGDLLSPSGLVLALGYVTWTSLGLVGGVLLGAAWVIYSQIERRIRTAEALKGEGRLGMLCTLGDMPITAHSMLAQHGAIPGWYLEETEHGQVLVDWINAHAVSHPAHARLLHTLIAAMCEHRDLPATHVEGGHGGKTLLDHSTRVAALTMEVARNFKYRGIESKYGETKPTVSGFKLDPQDPLLPIVGFAHDVGKLQCFVRDGKGKVIGSAPKHDMVGSRMLATLDEVKALPGLDQQALHLAICHYHHPSGYPLDKQGRIGSDRAAALMMALIQADKWAGSEEAKHSMTPQQRAAQLQQMKDLGEELNAQEEKELKESLLSIQKEAAQGAQPAPVASVTDEQMRAALIKILTDSSMVFTALPKGNAKAVAQVAYDMPPQAYWDEVQRLGGVDHIPDDLKEKYHQAKTRYIVANELKLRQALTKALSLQGRDRKFGDGRYLTTTHALRVLEQMGVLCSYTNTGRLLSVESSLYRVTWWSATEHDKCFATWNGAILLFPVNDLARYATGSVHPALVRIERPIWHDRLRPQGQASGGQDEVDPAELDEYQPDAPIYDSDEPDQDDGLPFIPVTKEQRQNQTEHDVSAAQQGLLDVVSNGAVGAEPVAASSKPSNLGKPRPGKQPTIPFTPEN